MCSELCNLPLKKVIKEEEVLKRGCHFRNGSVQFGTTLPMSRLVHHKISVLRLTILTKVCDFGQGYCLATFQLKGISQLVDSGLIVT